MCGAGRIVPGARQFVRDFLVSPMRHGSGEGHRLYSGALRIHIRDPLLQIDGAVGKRALEAGIRLDIETLVRRAILHTKARPIFGDHVQIGLREKMRVNIDRAHSW